MIIPLGSLLAGAALGMWRARANGGNWRDMAQWAASFGILFGIVGLFVLIFYSRSVA
ncbi:hypothetical protein SAMN05428995_103395 [Loktanella sp. DSM 29012]|uniref:Uncharacterized protein n=1 Tax=Loktanella gaetbuli TaxID=2881335 RepID=A0ABS8BQV5_9RHOB|nr:MULTISPECIES: hypothetical protein [Loktanella]MCB5198124.1 hypothetical protein [Loktanella gaetbuli]SEQ26204.1 hypothetical protein SAMN05428995_103395 [Loktanella sp. DSM 29012]